MNDPDPGPDLQPDPDLDPDPDPDPDTGPGPDPDAGLDPNPDHDANPDPFPPPLLPSFSPAPPAPPPPPTPLLSPLLFPSPPLLPPLPPPRSPPTPLILKRACFLFVQFPAAITDPYGASPSAVGGIAPFPHLVFARAFSVLDFVEPLPFGVQEGGEGDGETRSGARSEVWDVGE